MSKNKNRKEIVEFWKIRKLIEDGKYHLAVSALQDFLQKYPGDSYSLKEYASILRCQGEPEQALMLLSQCESDGEHSIRERAICYIYQEEYEKALLELNHISGVHDKDLKQVESFCRAKLGIETAEDSKYYSIQQAIEYDEEKAIEHIKNHGKNCGRDYFNPDIDIKELYYNIQSVLSRATPMINDSLLRYYSFFIKNVGYSQAGNSVNYLLVRVLPNSFDILTMFPDSLIRNTYINNYTTLLAEVQTEKSPKIIKRESQIDKFNRRYGKNN